LERRDERAAEAAATRTSLAPAAKPEREDSEAAPRRRSFRESRELEGIERDLPNWEARRHELEQLLATPGEGDYGLLEQLTHELAEVVDRIDDAEERWLVLSELMA